MINLHGMNIVPISFIEFYRQVSNDACKYTKNRSEKIHIGLEYMDYEAIKEIVRKPFWQETVELNDVIIPKYLSQYGKCYISA